MKTRSCKREPDVLDAVLAGRLTGDLRAHADECDACGEVAKVAGLVRDDFDRAKDQARVPTADVVWLRAQIRAREDAARIAARPIVWTQAMAVAALLGLLAALAGSISFEALVWPAFTAIPLHLLVIGAAGLSCVIFAPVALYFALSRD